MLKATLHSSISSLVILGESHVSVSATISALHVSIRGDRSVRLFITLRTFEKRKETFRPVTSGTCCSQADSYAEEACSSDKVVASFTRGASLPSVFISHTLPHDGK